MLLAACAEDKQSSQSEFPVIPDILKGVLCVGCIPAADRVPAVVEVEQSIVVRNALHNPRQCDADFSCVPAAGSNARYMHVLIDASYERLLQSTPSNEKIGGGGGEVGRRKV